MDEQDASYASGPTDWLATAAGSAHVAVGVSSLRSGEFVAVNDSFCRLFGFGRVEIIGRSSAALGLWPDARQRARLFELLRQRGSVTGFEARYRNRDGEVGDLEVSARIVERDGEPFLIGFLTEISDRRELIEGLRAAQSRLGVVLRASRMLVFRQDRGLRYTWVANPVLGAREDELIGRTDAEILGPAAAAPLVAIKRRVLESGAPERRDVWVANNGQLGCFDLVVEPERDAAGRVIGIVCAALDITQRMCEHQSALSAPSNSIRGLAALIGREPLTARQAQRLNRIEVEAGRLGTAASAPPAIERLQARHAGTRVVVAEHEPVMRELVCALLERAGLAVTPARTGVEALSYTLQLAPALLLLDLELPQRGGVAAARALRGAALRQLPIVAMLSANAVAAAADAGTELDADLDDLLDKPVAADRLYAKVLAWLEAGR
ncbi:MAG: PAS domain S-box protein [Burkholderiales bacterium]|nr:PAS domain S-box protein [Burkholderiales bacterium]MDE1927451.1 PAS domain S-box protein [Burkholderiales bacterium]MDE2504731.1 PAS domain S-box protein [Burkholderiales bacterium]